MYICLFNYLMICLISMECSIIILYGEEYCILVADETNDLTTKNFDMESNKVDYFFKELESLSTIKIRKPKILK